MTKIYDFIVQNKLGYLGEQLFCRAFNATPSDCLEYDCTLPDGRTVELKTENYKFNNLCVETFGNTNTMSVGGPWRAFRDGVDVYAHFFIKDGIVCFFDIVPFIRYLEENMDAFKPLSAKNKSMRGEIYSSSALLVPSYDVLPFITQIELIDSEGKLQNIEGL